VEEVVMPHPVAERDVTRETSPASSPIAAVAAAAAASVLAACGSGGGDDDDAAAGPPSAPAAPTAMEAARFLAQSTFGATDAEIASVQTMGYAAWLDQQLDKPVGRGYFDTLVDRGLKTEASGKFGANLGLDHSIYASYINAEDQVRKRVGFALSQIFVIGVGGLEANYRIFGAAAFLDMLESAAFGSFRDLLEAVSRHAAMGAYLTFVGSNKANPTSGSLPDENYAREVMQLFSIGLYALEPDGTAKQPPQETYTQSDVSELAKVFTGWRWTGFVNPSSTEIEFFRRPMSAIASQQSTEVKTFLGLTIPAGKGSDESLELAMDHLCNHANVGPFIGKQLIQRLVTSNPSRAYVRRVSAVFADNGLGIRGDLRAVVRAILLDPEARSPVREEQIQRGKVREPVIRLMHWARSFKATSADGKWTFGNLSDPASRLGQVPLRSPSVFNFYRPGYVPANTSIAEANLVAPEFQITSETSVVGYVNYIQRVIDGDAGLPSGVGDIRSTYADELALGVDALVDRLELLLVNATLGMSTRSTITNALSSMPVATDADKLNRVKAAVLLCMASPEYLIQK
jgi:uncharacterized protein (DUF1800 family)